MNDQHATAVQLFGEGDGDNEERLELRARSAAAIGLATVLRAGGRQFSAGRGNHTNGLLRIPVIGSRPYVVRQVSSPVIIGVGTRESSRSQHVGARCLRHGRGYRGTSQD